MSEQLETQVQDAPQTTETVVVSQQVNPFDDDAFFKPAEEAQNIVKQEAPKEEIKPPVQENVVDSNDWLKQKFGWENEELGRQEIETLRKFKEEAEKSPKLKFSDAIKEKEQDIYNYLSEKNRFEKVEKMDISKASDAAEILKMNLQYKHKDLTADEVDYLFNKNFQLPPKPVQTDDMLDEDYERAIANWKQDVDLKERGMIIEAKLAKPEILKYREALTPPDIQLNAEAGAIQQTAPTPEELAEAEKNYQLYQQSVSKGLNDFNGFTATYKDEEVEIPISYNVTPEEKAALKPIIDSLGKDMSYFFKRWTSADGTVNGQLLFEDLYLLENKGKVIQKFTNEAGTQANLHRMKQKNNIQLNTDAGRVSAPNEQASLLEKQIQAIWDA